MTTPHTPEAPKWEEITPALIELLHGDNDEAAAAAMKDLRRMSQLADRLGDMVAALQKIHSAAKAALTEYDEWAASDGITCANADALWDAIEQADQALSGKTPEEQAQEESRIVRPS